MPALLPKRLIALAGVIALAALIATQYLPSPAEAIFDDGDGDGAIDQAELISGSDPADPASVPEDKGAEFLVGSAVCRDGRDNDGDGTTDNLDPGCRDSDIDVVSDPMETLLGSNPNDGTSFPEDARLDSVADYYGIPIFYCADDVDNDRDGMTDTADPGCEPLGDDGDAFDDFTEKRYGSDPANANSVPEHGQVNPGSCADGDDNDLDGMTDGADPACSVPANDNRAAAVLIGSLPYATGPSVMKNATVEAGEPRATCVAGGATASVWYRYTADGDATLVADTNLSNFSTTLAVYHDTGAGLDELACTAYSPGGRAIFDAQDGATYYFQIGGFPFAEALPKLAFHVTIGNPPANDGFLSAAPIDGLPFADSADLTSARSEYGEPAPSCASIEDAATVWYRYEPAADTLLVLDTEGSDFASVIGVWQETIFGLHGVTCGVTYDIGGGARAAFHAEAGQVYFIQAARLAYAGFPGFDGYNLELSAEQASPLPNDDFAGAAAVGALPYHNDVEALTLSLEPGEPVPSCMFEPPLNSAWYKYTPATNTILRADSEGPDPYSSYIGIYTGSSISTLVEVGCAAPDYPYPEFALEALAGVTYYFQVGNADFFFGEGVVPDVSGWGAAAPNDVAGFPPPGGASRVYFNLESVPIPSCAAPQFTVPDPVGDQFNGFGPPEGRTSGSPGGFYQPDITSVRGGSDGQNFCMTVEFAEPIDPPAAGTERSITGYFEFDTDANRATGELPSTDFICPEPSGVRMEAWLSLFDQAGALIPIYGVGPDGDQYALARYGERSLTLTIPLLAIGGDTAFDFAMVLGTYNAPTDCAPNGGSIHSPNGALNPPWLNGDVNCNNSPGPVDASLILQLNAGLVDTLPCEEAGDVNGDGEMNAIDSSFLLQLYAGLIPSLPQP